MYSVGETSLSSLLQQSSDRASGHLFPGQRWELWGLLLAEVAKTYSLPWSAQQALIALNVANA